MKILIEQTEEITRSLVIDTDNYTKQNEGDDRAFEIAEIINEAKADPSSFFVEDMHAVEESRESIRTRVEKA